MPTMFSGPFDAQRFGGLTINNQFKPRRTKSPFKLKEIRAIRIRLQIGRLRCEPNSDYVQFGLKTPPPSYSNFLSGFSATRELTAPMDLSMSMVDC